MTEAQENSYEALHAVGWECIPGDGADLQIILNYPKGRGVIREDGRAELEYEKVEPDKLNLSALHDYGG